MIRKYQSYHSPRKGDDHRVIYPPKLRASRLKLPHALWPLFVNVVRLAASRGDTSSVAVSRSHSLRARARPPDLENKVAHRLQHDVLGPFDVQRKNKPITGPNPASRMRAVLSGRQGTSTRVCRCEAATRHSPSRGPAVAHEDLLLGGADFGAHVFRRPECMVFCATATPLKVTEHDGIRLDHSRPGLRQAAQVRDVPP